jgi:hypothetical protein
LCFLTTNGKDRQRWVGSAIHSSPLHASAVAIGLS